MMIEFATSATPATTTYGYDAAGRLHSVNGPRSDVTDVTDYGYDLADRLTSVTQNGIALPPGTDAVTTTYLYDDAGELVRITQPLTTTLTQVRDFTFDTTGRTASSIDARGTTTYTYGAGDQLEQVADPRGVTLKYEYDNLGRQTRRYRSAPSVADDQTFTYDQAGNMLTARVVSSGTTITMEYNDDGRLWKVYQASPTPTTTFTYSPTTGLLSQVADAAGTTSYTYRASDGLLEQITDPFGYPVTYSYDGAGRATQRTDGSAMCWKQDYESGTGRIDRRTIYASSQCTGTYRARFDLGYDPASNITSRIQYVAGNSSGSDTTAFTYTYDGANRLLSSTAPSSANNREYTWDGGGNRTSVRLGTGNPVTMTYDAAGLPVSSSDGITYTHDALGNLTLINRSGTKNDRYFTYSSFSQLTKSAKTAGGSDIVYTLDALDRVLSRAEGSTTSSYTYSGVGEALAKAQVGSTVTTYANTPSGPLGQKVGTTVRYYLADLHGDTVGWSNTASALQGTAAYDPFGQVLSVTGEMGTISSQGSFRFQSDLTDLTTGQVDMGARYYEPVLGRFSSADPLRGELTAPISLNRFVYAMASPVTYSDLTGLRGKSGNACYKGRRCQAAEETGSGGAPGQELPDLPLPSFEKSFSQTKFLQTPAGLVRIEWTWSVSGGDELLALEWSNLTELLARVSLGSGAVSMSGDTSGDFRVDLSTFDVRYHDVRVRWSAGPVTGQIGGVAVGLRATFDTAEVHLAKSPAAGAPSGTYRVVMEVVPRTPGPSRVPDLDPGAGWRAGVVWTVVILTLGGGAVLVLI